MSRKTARPSQEDHYLGKYLLRGIGVLLVITGIIVLVGRDVVTALASSS